MANTPAVNELKEAKEQERKTSQQFNEAQLHSIRELNGFFERLSLLSGGALVLSVSFLGYLSARTGRPLQFVSTLHLCWGLLLLSLLTSLFRNMYNQHYLFHTKFSWWARDVETLKEAEINIAEARTPILSSSSHTILAGDELQQFVDSLKKKKETWAGSRTTSEAKATRFERLFVFCQYASQIAFFLGLVLLTFFATVNAP